MTAPTLDLDAVVDVDLDAVIPCQRTRDGRPICDQPAVWRSTTRCCRYGVNLCHSHAVGCRASLIRAQDITAAAGRRVCCQICQTAPYPGTDWRKL